TYGGHDPILSGTMYGLLAIGCLNTVLSLVYYINVLKVMVLERPPEESEGTLPRPLAIPTGSVVYASLLAVAVLVLGILWDPLADSSARGAEPLKMQKPFLRERGGRSPG